MTTQATPPDAGPGRVVARTTPATIAVVAAAGCVLTHLVLTAPQPPEVAALWRWLTVAVAVVLCGWNVTAALRSYQANGPLSVVSVLHLWALFAFSFPALEGSYRYDEFQTALWRTSTNTAVAFWAAVLVAAFQILFFVGLRPAAERTLVDRLDGSRATRPHLRLAGVFLVLLVPLVAARVLVLRDLGFRGAVTAAVTRVSYFDELDNGVHPVVWLLNGIFPIVAVALCCLVVKYIVPHPSARGCGLYVLTVFGCIGGVAVSGGRADLAFVPFIVVVFMYVSGYRSRRQLLPMLVPLVAVAALLFLVAQARTGGSNTLSDLAGDPYGDYNAYTSGDITQVLGLGRFDAVVMILDQHGTAENLTGRSYVYALAGGLNSTFLPRIATGDHLPIYHVSDAVLGFWIFGEGKTSALPSAPGELYLNFGVAGVLIGAFLLGRGAAWLLRMVGRLPGPVEFAWVLVVWTIARMLSDESYVVATFAGRNWPFMLAISLLILRTAPTVAGRFPAPLPGVPASGREPAGTVGGGPG